MKASDFKAQCLGVLDEVGETGETVVITKRGRPVAQLSPFIPPGATYPQHTLIGTVEILGDTLEPLLPPEASSAARGETP